MGRRCGQAHRRPTLTLRTGGFAADELLEAGAAGVFNSLPELQSSIGNGLLVPPR